MSCPLNYSDGESVSYCFFFDIFFKSGKLPLENTDFVQNCYVDYKRFRHEHFIGGEGGVVGLICGKRKLN